MNSSVDIFNYGMCKRVKKDLMRTLKNDTCI